MAPPPWLCHLLATVKNVASDKPSASAGSGLAPVAWINDTYSVSDVEYIETCVKSSPFDTLGLQRDIYEGFKAGTVLLEKKSSIYGSVLVLYHKDQPWAFPYKAVGSVMKLFYKEGKPFRFLFFGSQVQRQIPIQGESVAAAHVNGGYTFPCNPQSVVVYRREEVVRVLIHECYHASCSDPQGIDLPYVEADTEAWAEITLCALAARGRFPVFNRLFRAQMEYARGQCKMLSEVYNVSEPSDYAWRYTIGKLNRWRALGFKLPNGISYSGNSLRLTLEFPGVEDSATRK